MHALQRCLSACLFLGTSACMESQVTLRPACGAVSGFQEIDLTLEGVEVGRKLDLLFVIDNSGSMGEEQESMAALLPFFAETLLRGDFDRDGVPDFEPIVDVHIGVVSTDMGVAGHEGIPTCSANAGSGDDGILRTAPGPGREGCEASYPGILAFRPDEHSADLAEAIDAYGADLGCMVQLGVSGCGHEQPLEAALKALTPSSNTAITFMNGSLGHGDAENAGFLRSDSVLAIVVVTDEEDCSVADGFGELFDPLSTTYTGDPNLRCFEYPETRWPVERYIDGFRALRPGASNRLVFAAITGVPVETVSDPSAIDYQAVLDHPDMVEQVRTDGEMAGHQLRPACTAPAGRGEAMPARRLVQVAQALSAHAVVQSICQLDYGPILDRIILAINNTTLQGCVSEPLERDASGEIACTLELVLPSVGSGATRCNQIEGAITSETTVVGGREQCRLPQLAVHAESGAPVVESGVGWYYDDFSARVEGLCGSRAVDQAIVFESTEVPAGAEARLRCFTKFEGSPLHPPTRGVGSACTGNDVDECEEEGLANLFCERSTDTCQIECNELLPCPSPLTCDLSQGSGSSYCVPAICVDR